MRKVLLTLLVIGLALPAVAFAMRAVAKEGTLSIKNGDGMVYIHARGGIIGQVDKAQRIVLIDVQEDDGSGPSITGCDGNTYREKSTEDGEGTHVTCKGSKIKFKLIGGRYRMRVVGKGIDISAVGRSLPDNHVLLDGNGEDTGLEDGTFSIDGADYQSLPNKQAKRQFGSG